LCVGCHRTMGENPIDHAELYRSIWGNQAYELLRELKERIVRKKDRPEKEIAKHYRKELARMHDARERGFDGRIELVGWL